MLTGGKGKHYPAILGQPVANELLRDERSLLYLMSDLYIVDEIVKELSGQR